MPINIYALFTIPVLILILGEILYCVFTKKNYYTFQDSVSSLGTAIINQCVNLLVSLIFFPAYKLINDSTGLGLPETWWSFVLLFVGVDFLFYWFHRMGHKINILWAAHMPHHSTEEFNYAVALRASVTQRLASFFFYWPLALFWKAEYVLPMVAFHLVLQLIPHTRVVPKLPRFIESWMNTPSHHRVHHACNKQYRNTNFAGFLIIWDKMFGTYVEETEEPYYGVTTPPGSWDPLTINFQWWGYLFSDMIHTKSWIEKFKLWFMPIGYRPKDLPPRKVYSRPDGVKQVKFKTTEFPHMRGYLVTQILLSMFIMLTVTATDSPLRAFDKFFVSILLCSSAVLWAGILESKKWALSWEPFKNFAVVYLLSYLILEYLDSFQTAAVLGVVVLYTFVMIWFLRITKKVYRGNLINF